MIAPWIIQEAEIALYPAWKDGMPFRGPGQPRGVPSPVVQCVASLSIAHSPNKGAATGHSWIGNEPTSNGDWDISISFPDGAFSDDVSRVLSRLASGGFHVLVVRFYDARVKHWSCFRFFYTTIEADEDADSNQLMVRSLRLKSTWLQETVGADAMPTMAPVVYGEVDWVCGSQRITCMTYDPETETWLSLPRNDTGDGTRYVNISPVLDEPTDIAVSAYFPRVVPGDQVLPALPRGQVLWQNIVVIRIGNHLSPMHHGLILQGGLALQADGISEPLLSYPQDRMLDEPVIVFRYLSRVYACIGHGVLAVPRLLVNTPPPFTHDYPFRLCPAGDANPETDQSGLVLLPDGAWLDGTVTEIL